MRLTVTRWKRFLRGLDNGHSWKPFRDFDPDEFHLFASRLANRHLTWQELSKPWKAVLRRRRKQRDAESLRIGLEADDA
jgi:hypothetical protein